jgi:hypothetical protein
VLACARTHTQYYANARADFVRFSLHHYAQCLRWFAVGLGLAVFAFITELLFDKLHLSDMACVIYIRNVVNFDGDDS